MANKLQLSYTAIDAWEAEVAQTGDDKAERDSDGYVIDDPRDHLIYQASLAEEARGALVKGFVIALFHCWERSAREWTGRAHGRFITLCADVIAVGHPIDPRLNELYVLVNLLKHGNKEHGQDLFQLRPNLFPAHFDPTRTRGDWYEVVDISDADLFEFFDIIARSGPGS